MADGVTRDGYVQIAPGMATAGYLITCQSVIPALIITCVSDQPIPSELVRPLLQYGVLRHLRGLPGVPSPIISIRPLMVDNARLMDLLSREQQPPSNKGIPFLHIGDLEQNDVEALHRLAAAELLSDGSSPPKGIVRHRSDLPGWLREHAPLFDQQVGPMTVGGNLDPLIRFVGGEWLRARKREPVVMRDRDGNPRPPVGLPEPWPLVDGATAFAAPKQLSVDDVFSSDFGLWLEVSNVAETVTILEGTLDEAQRARLESGLRDRDKFRATAFEMLVAASFVAERVKVEFSMEKDTGARVPDLKLPEHNVYVECCRKDPFSEAQLKRRSQIERDAFSVIRRVAARGGHWVVEIDLQETDAIDVRTIDAAMLQTPEPVRFKGSSMSATVTNGSTPSEMLGRIRSEYELAYGWFESPQSSVVVGIKFQEAERKLYESITNTLRDKGKLQEKGGQLVAGAQNIVALDVGEQKPAALEALVARLRGKIRADHSAVSALLLYSTSTKRVGLVPVRLDVTVNLIKNDAAATPLAETVPAPAGLAVVPLRVFGLDTLAAH